MLNLSGNDNIISGCVFNSRDSLTPNPNSATTENSDIYAIYFGGSAGNLIDTCKFLGFALRSPFHFATSAGLNIVANCWGAAVAGGATAVSGAINAFDSVDYVQTGSVIKLRRPYLHTWAADDAAAAAAGVPLYGLYIKNGTQALTQRAV